MAHSLVLKRTEITKHTEDVRGFGTVRVRPLSHGATFTGNVEATQVSQLQKGSDTTYFHTCKSTSGKLV